METLKIERAKLAEAEYNSYDADAFPGSARWMKNKKANDALKVFDLAHPEVVAEIREEKKAAEKAKYDALSDFVKSGS
jgi:hypothetical protein